MAERLHKIKGVNKIFLTSGRIVGIIISVCEEECAMLNLTDVILTDGKVLQTQAPLTVETLDSVDWLPADQALIQGIKKYMKES